MNGTRVALLTLLLAACDAEMTRYTRPGADETNAVATPPALAAMPTPAVTSRDPGEPWTGPLAGPVSIGPLPQPPSAPFVSNPEFADCVHPGVQQVCEDGWCRVPAGCFVFGSPEDEPRRAAYDENQARVTLTHDFEIQQTEVTLAQWEAAGLFEFPNLKIGLDGSGPCTDPKCAVKNATWYQALRHANWLSEQRGLAPCYRVYECDELSEGFCMVELLAETAYECEGYRLPTSAEWEYSARAGTTTTFYSGPMTRFEKDDWCNWDPNLVRVAWYCANVPAMQEQPVAQLLPNAWGLYDVLGNAQEYTWDADRGVATPDPSTDPAGALDHHGAAITRSCPPNGWGSLCRVASSLLGYRDKGDAGFRLVRTLGKGTLPTLDDVAPEYRNGWDRPE